MFCFQSKGPYQAENLQVRRDVFSSSSNFTDFVFRIWWRHIKLENNKGGNANSGRYLYKVASSVMQLFSVFGKRTLLLVYKYNE